MAKPGKTAVYQEIFHRRGWIDQLGIAVNLATEVLQITCHRDSEYSEHEVELARLIQQHMVGRFHGLCVGCNTKANRWEIPLRPEGTAVAIPTEIGVIFGQYCQYDWESTLELPQSIQRWVRSVCADSQAEVLPHWRITSRAGALLLWYRKSILNRQAALLVEERKNNYHYDRLKHLGFTPRQIDIAFWLTQGKTDWEIGLLLVLSPRTVSKHLESVFAKLGCSNRTAAAICIMEWLQQ